MKQNKVLKKKVLQALRIPESELKQYRIYKKSIDARRKHNIQFTYTIDAEVRNEKQVLKANKKLVLAPLIQYTFPKTGDKLLEHRPVIVGAGPCGLFSGWLLAEAGYKPIVIERGETIDERTLSVEAFWKDGALIHNQMCSLEKVERVHFQMANLQPVLKIQGAVRF